MVQISNYSMEQNEGPVIGLSGIMKITGFPPIMLGTAFILSPTTAIAVGPFLTEYGLFVSLYVGVFAICLGLVQWLVSIYVNENLHIFGRFFSFCFFLTILLEIYGWTSGLMEFELKFLFATMFPVSACFILLISSISPHKPKGN